MKTILCLLPFLFLGCVTTTAPDGTTTRQTDYKAVHEIGNIVAGFAGIGSQWNTLQHAGKTIIPPRVEK